jgi:hypothetical protein
MEINLKTWFLKVFFLINFRSYHLHIKFCKKKRFGKTKMFKIELDFIACWAFVSTSCYGMAPHYLTYLILERSDHDQKTAANWENYNNFSNKTLNLLNIYCLASLAMCSMNRFNSKICFLLWRFDFKSAIKIQNI